MVTLLLRRAVEGGEIVDCDTELAADTRLSSVTIDLFLAQHARGWPVERIADGARWLLDSLTRPHPGTRVTWLANQPPGGRRHDEQSQLVGYP